MATDLIIVGASGFGREVAWLASEASESYRVLGFLDDRRDISTSQLGGLPWLGVIDEWRNFSSASFVVAIGIPRTRAKVVERMQSYGKPNFATLIHRNLCIGPACVFAPGAIVCAGCIITTNISIGSHAIINIGCTIGHDVRIGSFVTLAPQVAISGCVTLSDGVEIGTSASVLQGLTIEKGAMLGMGSVLTKNIVDSSLYFGVPAKSIKELAPFL